MKKVNFKKPQSISKLVAIIVFVVLSIAVIVLNDYIFREESIFYEGSSRYAFASLPSFLRIMLAKVPNLLSVMIIITFSIVLFKVVKAILIKILKKDKRALTISSLLISVAKWVIIIVDILAVFGAFGVDTTTLLASAGILTLVIGLGAQSLVSDILAGFFLVFEGEYEVGDIVSIDGWRGTVKSIGIRVTQLEDVGGNIKTINNSDVRNVVNQTSLLSVAKVTMPIDYDQSLEEVEVLLEKRFENIKERIPLIVDGPYYKGVSELGESSVNLLIIAKCKENDLYQVQRDLTRDLYIMFNENHISVPFNQIVLSNRETIDSNEASKKTKKAAKEFVEEQKKLSKDIAEDDNK